MAHLDPNVINRRIYLNPNLINRRMDDAEAWFRGLPRASIAERLSFARECNYLCSLCVRYFLLRAGFTQDEVHSAGRDAERLFRMLGDCEVDLRGRRKGRQWVLAGFIFRAPVLFEDGKVFSVWGCLFRDDWLTEANTDWIMRRVEAIRLIHAWVRAFAPYARKTSIFGRPRRLLAHRETLGALFGDDSVELDAFGVPVSADVTACLEGMRGSLIPERSTKSQKDSEVE
jgi:hypothetical protein